MKKNLLAFALAFFVLLSFNSTFVASAIDGISADDTVQPMDMLNETFIEHDYATGEETTFTYADVVDSLREIDPEYTDYSEPFHANEIVFENTIGGEIADPMTVQPGSLFNLIEDYVAPYKYTVAIDVIKSNGTIASGTGFMVSKYVMLTCAHVVWGDDVEEIKIYPFNNEVITSLEDEPYYHPRSWVVSTNYSNATSQSMKDRYDWCYMTLHEPLGEETGYYSFTSIHNSTTNLAVSVTGYPGNNTTIPNFRRYGQYMSQGTLSVLNEQRVIHTCSTLAGQSGSPVYTAGNYVVAIHTGGGDSNYGVRITATLYNLLTNKISEVG